MKVYIAEYYNNDTKIHCVIAVFKHLVHAQTALDKVKLQHAGEDISYLLSEVDYVTGR